jgi:hypothetical protein
MTTDTPKPPKKRKIKPATKPNAKPRPLPAHDYEGALDDILDDDVLAACFRDAMTSRGWS